MTTRPDLTPAAQRLAELLGGVSDDQLKAPTPCPEYTLGDLIDHVNGLSAAFTMAATKEFGDAPPAGPAGDASRLEPDWRVRIPERLAAMAEAWRAPDAWSGMTQAGGVDLPGEVGGVVALTEIVVHGWDVARASGQPFDADPGALEACIRLAEPQPGEDRSGGGSPFGPIVEVPAGAPALDRLIGLTGRDPSWTP